MLLVCITNTSILYSKTLLPKETPPTPIKTKHSKLSSTDGLNTSADEVV